MPARQRALVLLPTYNERENLPLLVAELRTRQPGVDLLVIDDGSPDGTGEVADELAATDAAVHVLHRPTKQGLGRAYVAGFEWALAHRYDRVVQMDADFSHRPCDLGRLLEAARRHPVVVGSRYVSGGRIERWSVMRRALSRAGSAYARLILGGGPKDYTGGFRCLDRSVLESIDLGRISSNGYAFQVEINYACRRTGHPTFEVPIVFAERAHGRSKMSLEIAVEAALLVLRLRLGLARTAAVDPRRPAAAER